MIGLLIHDLAQPHFQTERRTQFQTAPESGQRRRVLVRGEDIGILHLFLY
ncbi:hypothetical protein E2C01_045651 [Portunus trituberculatus]|uniref:Uncharacterized protein n=1 Tax=Portunus trituberculatus TaxID=210409 RepID=A0A5B7G2L9_PORTR|nr:hypothetical protein [Portunus trituberculatus]